MRLLALLLGVSALTAQEPGFRAEIVEKAPAAGGSLLLMRDRNYRLFRCLLTSEKDSQPPVRAGDVVEWFQVMEPGDCRVDRIKFLGRPTDPDTTSLRGTRLRLDLNPLNSILRRGNLHYGGTVTDIQPGRIELRTRKGERFPVILREDTHFFRDGLPTTEGQLVRNMVVSVRAGKNFAGDVEAFYVMWGGIIRPE